MVGRLYHLPAPRARERADELLERFGLADAADRLVKTYSGGMRRRLDLAASLVAAPPVLFLDEPTTGLDPASRRELWALLGELVRDGDHARAHDAVPRGGRPRSPTRSSSSTTAASPPPARPAELKARIGGERVEVTVAAPAELEAAAAARWRRSPTASPTATPNRCR